MTDVVLEAKGEGAYFFSFREEDFLFLLFLIAVIVVDVVAAFVMV